MVFGVTTMHGVPGYSGVPGLPVTSRVGQENGHPVPDDPTGQRSVAPVVRPAASAGQPTGHR